MPSVGGRRRSVISLKDCVNGGVRGMMDEESRQAQSEKEGNDRGKETGWRSAIISTDVGLECRHDDELLSSTSE